MQQAVRNLNSPLSDVRVGNTATADRGVADAWTAASNHVCQDTSSAVGKASPGPAESVRPGGTGRQLGKTRSLAVQGGEVTVDAARVISKHTERISPSGI